MPSLSSATCAAWLSDPNHLFASMWGAEPWTTRNSSAFCWEVGRNASRARQPATLFTAGIRDGRHCHENWLSGNAPRLGAAPLPSVISNLKHIGKPNFEAAKAFTKPAPALLGFDSAIHQHCSAALGTRIPFADFEHAAACVAANRNILWLKQDAVGKGRIAFNVCRNLEWIECAAHGSLPGQQVRPGAGSILFAQRPRLLNVDRDPKLDSCRKDATSATSKCPDGPHSYTSSDVYYLEICLLSQLCRNGYQLFSTRAGLAGEESGEQQLKSEELPQPQPEQDLAHDPMIFRCDYSEELRDALMRTILAVARRNAMRNNKA